VRAAAAALAACTLLAACGGDDGGDRVAFCEAFAELRDDDPFADLAVASPGEMRDAFAALADGAERMADEAPAEAGVQADRYADAVEGLRDELAGGGYDLTQIDTRRYRDGVEVYGDAATSLANAARSICDDDRPSG